MLNMGITVPNKRLKSSPIGTSQHGSDKLRILLKGLICALFIASLRFMAFSSSILSQFDFISSSSLELSCSFAIVDWSTSRRTIPYLSWVSDCSWSWTNFAYMPFGYWA